jgi:adenosylmethionine-8-amino-7-oxononanoate aminotransferase
MAPALVNEGNIVNDPHHGTINTQDMTEDKSMASSAVLHRSLHHDPLLVVSASGNYLNLSNGQQIFDASGGAAVACLGHGNEK